MSRLRLVQGDTRPPVYVHLTDRLGVINVSGGTVLLKFRRVGEEDVLETITGELLEGSIQQDGYTPDTSQYPTPGSGGRVSFTFPDGSLDIDPGYYEGEIEITFSDASVQTVYEKLKFTLREQF